MAAPLKMAPPDLSDKYLFYVRRGLDDSDPSSGGLVYLQPPDEGASADVPTCKIASPSHKILDAVRDWVVPFVLAPPPDSKPVYHVICNPSAGAGKAERWLEQVVEPLLTFAGAKVEKHLTTGPGDAGNIGKKIVEAHSTSETLKIVVLGGDGSTAEFLNGVAKLQGGQEATLPPLDLLPVPLGTANALFFHLHPNADLSKPKDVLTSLIASLIEGVPSPRSLPLSQARVLSADDKVAHEAVAAVVVSTALHASILKTADTLRAEIEGLGRFKKAFELNVVRTWKGKLGLPGKDVSLYDPAKKGFTPFDATSLEGPFSYFASAQTDRFEQKFIIAPLRLPSRPVESSAALGLDQSVDLVVVRPRRKPDLQDATDDEVGAKFAGDITQTMMKAYEDGAHVDLKHEGDHPIVEYIRTPSWTWTPVRTHVSLKATEADASCEQDAEEQGDVCIDGAVVEIPKGGRVDLTVLSRADVRAF